MNKLIQVIILISGLVVMSFFAIDLRSDYYYHYTKKDAVARITDLEQIEGNKPILVHLEYNNQFLNKSQNCEMKIDGRFAKEIKEKSLGALSIAYTQKSPLDIYIIDYKHPNWGGTILHSIFFLIALLGVILFSRNLFRRF